MGTAPLPDNQRERLAASSRSAERVQFLNELMRIATSSVDMAGVFHQVGEHVKQVIDFDWMDIARCVPDEDYLVIFAFISDAPEMLDTGTRIPLQTGPGEVARTGHPIIRKNMPEESIVYPFELAVATEKGLRSAMFVPLESKGQVIGSLNFASHGLAKYGEPELQVAQEIAGHLAVLLEHAVLYEESKELAQRLQTLNKLMKIATSTLDMAEVFDLVGEEVKQLIDYDRMSIAIRPSGEDYGEMYAVAVEGQPVFDRGTRFALDEAVMGEVILTGRPMLRKHIPEESVYPHEFAVAKQHGIRSAMFVPLQSKSRVIGSLNFASCQAARYGQEELQTAQEIADHLAVILEHAMLFEESKQAEETLRRLNKQLENVNHHKSEFLANMSHELRTPLNAILGSSELLGEGLFGELNEKQMEYIQDIHESGDHLLSLINDVLDLSKVEAGKLDLQLSHIDLRSLVESSSAIVRERAAGRSQEFLVVPPPEDVIFEADERKVKQIVYNLLSNAVKFTPENGRVTFSAHREKHEVIFAVEDTGPGVAEELRERIFEEFFQISDNQEGTGLGLALSKRLVELHGGRIWLESQVGCGSRFFFSIPINDQ